MTVSRTPKNKTENIFDPPTAQLFEDVDGEDNAKVSDDRVAELEKALKELQEKNAEERSDALLSQPSHNNWQSQVTQDVETKPESIPLPDPALDPDGFSNATTRRAEIAYENLRRRDAAQNKMAKDIDEKVADLWADFGDAYPEMSEDKDRIDYVATQVVKEATRKGLDINRYMFGTGRERFMKDVVKKYTKVFGDPETDEDDYDDNPRSRRSASSVPSRRRSANRNRAEEDDGRSSGIFGGDESGGRPNRRQTDDETGPSMIDDIHAMQRRTGFF